MRDIIHILILTCTLLALNGCQSNQTDTTFDLLTSVQKIDSLLKSHHQEDLFHGGIMISNNGENIYENYLGIADRTWNIPMQSDVKFDIASLNKSMIAALILKATEENKLHLDDKLVDLLSGFSFEGNFHPDITLHHLLSHSSGLLDYDAIPNELKAENFLKFKRLRLNNEEYINFISQIEPVLQPDQRFYYSNFAYHLLAIILEKTYEKPFGQVFKENLTLPLGLKNTLSENRNEIVIENLAPAYNYQEKTDSWYQNPFIDLSLGRRVFSTVSDLNRWAQVMDNPGYLSQHSLNLMQQNHVTHLSNNISYGYGWVVVDSVNQSQMGYLDINKPYIIHGGSTDGYKAMLVNINHGEYIISFCSNVGDQTNELQLTQEIVKLLIE